VSGWTPARSTHRPTPDPKPPGAYRADVPTAALNGIDVYYEREGDGPRVLFLNGSGSTLEEARPMLDRLRPHVDLLAHDQRGLGRTSIPDGPYTMADYAADAAALATHVGWDRYRVVGISFGGMVAQELAVTVPERIERLALLVTSAGGAGGASYPLHTLAELPAEERGPRAQRLMDTRFTPEWLAEHPAERMIVEALAKRSAVVKPAEVLRGERLQMQARRHHDVYDRLPRIACPTFVGSGRYDGIAPPANGEAIAAQIAGAEFRVYDGGHGYLHQDRRGFPDVIEFLLGAEE
jgi:3-oxoadipate enol-lactonase